jgi:ankyrin repeat protein
VYKSRLAIVKLLIEAGADVNVIGEVSRPIKHA